MAISTGYFGLRRGSTKSHTFSVVDGKQITKDRVEGGKDPRTLSQMTQRCYLSTCGNAYAAMKCICDHSFEGKTAGMQCMREFMSTNLKQIQISKEYDNGFFGFNKYKESGLKPGSYVISKGSLPYALVDAEIASVSVTDNKVTLNLASGNSIGDIADSMGCKIFGDICTVAVMYPKTDGNYGFGVVRFTYKSAITVLDSFTVAVTGDAASATTTFTNGDLKVEVRMSSEMASGASADNTYMAAITSRKVNGSWLRSSAQFDVMDATPSFAQAISTYPVGQERFMNGSRLTSETSSSSEDSENTGGNSGGTDSGNTGGNTGGDNGGGDDGGGDDGGGGLSEG